VVDYRLAQLRRLRNVEIARGSAVSAEEILGYDFDHVAVATGARWRDDLVGRESLRPLPLDERLEVLTPDDLMRGSLPQGERVVVYDDDHFYMGGVLAELLSQRGRGVVLVTPALAVSAWTEKTMEQPRIHRRLVEAGVEIILSHRVLRAAKDHLELQCVLTERVQTVAVDALVPVTARLPNDRLVADLAVQAVGPVVEAIGDASAPGTIAGAVWDGHRYAEELEDPEAGDADLPPFRRERLALPS
jgi:dimethylamine/trimethylamine dehydrogenase